MSAQDGSVSILWEDAALTGRIVAQDLTIFGRFEGDIIVTGRLRVGPKAKVTAKVKAQSVEVEGEFEGEIRSNGLTFAPSARAKGLFLADRLAIRDGAVVEGAFNLPTGSDARPDAKPEVAFAAASPTAVPTPSPAPETGPIAASA